VRRRIASDLTGSVIAIDTETTGLKPHLGHRIFCLAYCTDKGEYGYLEWDAHAKRFIQDLFNDASKTITFHGAKFDLKMFQAEGIDIFDIKATIDCTLILSKLFNENGQHTLRYLAVKHLGADPSHKDEIEEWIKANSRRFVRDHGRKPNFSDAPRDIVKNRVVWDVKEGIGLWYFFYPKIDRTCAELYATERDLMFVCADMESYGVEIDLTKAEELKADCLEGVEQFQEILDETIGEINVKRTRKGTTVYELVDGFKASSNAHCEAAWKKLGIPLRFKTKPKKKKDKQGRKTKTAGGNWSFDEYAMVRYVSTPLVFAIRESSENGWHWAKFYAEVKKAIKENKLHSREIVPPIIWKIKQLKKMVSTYYDHFLNNCTDIRVEPSGRRVGTLHCKFNQSEAMTGRFSSSEPNLQNQPRKLGPRECFIPRRGRRNFHIDYDQVEMKFFTHFAEDESMRKAVEADIHLHTAARCYGLDPSEISGEQRKRAKAVNFGILYGAGPPTIAEALTKKGLPTTNLEAATICSAYHRAFPSVRKLTDALARDIKLQGYVVNPFGRRYHIPSRYAYTALNYLCQGTSADLMKAAMVRTWKWLRENKLKTRLVLTVHDEIVFEIPRSEEWVIPELIEIMEDHETFKVPITASPEIVRRRWSKKEKYAIAA